MGQRTKWLRNGVFHWEPECHSWHVNRQSSVNRAYEYWEHARKLLEAVESPFQLVDAIANLKRAINHRLKAIEAAYSLRWFPMENRPAGYLEILERIGLIRPALLKYLLDVRNAIEHQDKRPPSAKRCREFLDMSWYFLRSTDSVVREISRSVGFGCFTPTGEETQYGFTVNMTFGKRPRFEISGWFPIALVTEKQDADASPIHIKTINTKARWKEHGAHTDKLDSDLWIIARLEPTPPAAHRIITAALGTAQNGVNSIYRSSDQGSSRGRSLVALQMTNG